MENSARLLASIMMTTLSSTTEKKNEKNNTDIHDAFFIGYCIYKIQQRESLS